MAVVKELIDGRTFETDLFDNRVGTRRFAVLQCSTPYAATSAFDIEPGVKVFPDYLNPRTGTPLLELHTYTVSSEGGNAVYYIDATYRPVLPPTLFRYAWDYVKLTQDMPIVAPAVITPNTQADELSGQLVYGYHTLAVSEKRIRRSLTTHRKYSGSYGDTYYELDVIAGEVDKLHSIFGSLHQFIGADVRPDTRDPGIFAITYTWELDQGTPYPPLPVSQVVQVGIAGEPININIIIRPDPPEPPEEPSSLWRPPYARLIPYSTNPARPPKASIFYPYVINTQGWRQLPGMDQWR